MRFYTVLASRPQYYDRAPLDVVEFYGATSVAPHAVTTRWTYTVPSSRKAYVELVTLSSMRDAAAGTPGFDEAQLRLAPGGAGATNIAEVYTISNTVGAIQQQIITSVGLLQAGDVLSARTSDPSLTGTFTYIVTAKLTEFDA